MPRPIANNAEYFPHDNNMRDGKRVKALRAKFKTTGYGFYNMFLEVLTGSEHLRIDLSDPIDLEVVVGDFQMSTEDFQEILSYCVRIGLFQEKNNVYSCSELERRLAPVFEKRKLDRERAENRIRGDNGRFRGENNNSRGENTKDSDVSATDSPQSKGKESTVQKSKASEPKKNFSAEEKKLTLASFLKMLEENQDFFSIDNGYREKLEKQYREIRTDARNEFCRKAGVAMQFFRFQSTRERAKKVVHEIAGLVNDDLMRQRTSESENRDREEFSENVALHA